MLGMRLILVTTVALSVAACTVPSNRPYDWDNYDVRDVQPNYDEGYYQDNDSLYTPPTSYGCSPQDIGSIGCE